MLYIQEHFEGMPCETATLFGQHGTIQPSDKWCDSIKVGETIYVIRENQLIAHKVLGFFFVDSHQRIYALGADGKRWYLRLDEDSKFFRSPDDYYRFVEGDKTAPIKLVFSKLLAFHIPAESLLKFSADEDRKAKWYYTWNCLNHEPQRVVGHIRRLFFNGEDWFIQASPYRDKAMPKNEDHYYLTKADCIKANMVKEIVDFSDDKANSADLANKAEIKVEIKVDAPSPKVRRLTITEE